MHVNIYKQMSAITEFTIHHSFTIPVIYIRNYYYYYYYIKVQCIHIDIFMQIPPVRVESLEAGQEEQLLNIASRIVLIFKLYYIVLIFKSILTHQVETSGISY